MESITFELCVATGDPLDRTLSILVRSADTLVAHKAIRIAPEYPIGTVLLHIDRITLGWVAPHLAGDQHLWDLLDTTETSIGVPF